MPRKRSGIAISTIEPSIVASSTASVVFDNAIHLYRSESTGNLHSLPAYNPTVTRPAQIAGAASELRLVLGQLVRRLRREYTFPVAQATVLSRLDREGAQTTSALAAAERVRPQSMAQTIAELAAEALVTRRPDPADGRQILIELTGEGRDRLHEERRRREGWLAEAIAAELTAEEQQVLIAAVPLLRRLSES
jgi:DNA-binding MarR family transcriptional regulator